MNEKQKQIIVNSLRTIIFEAEKIADKGIWILTKVEENE